MKVFIVLATVLACANANPGISPYYSAGFGPAAAYTSAYQTTAYHGYPYAAAPFQHYSAAAAPIHYSAAVAPAFVAPAFSKTQYHAQDELGQYSTGYAYPGQAHSSARSADGSVRGSYAYVNPDGNEIRVNYVADAGGFRAESNALPQAPVHVVPAPLAGPAPVLDTPEVVEARAAHARAHEEAKLRSLRKKRGVIAAPALTYTAAAHPLAYSAAAYPALSYSALSHPALAYNAGYPAGFGYSAAAVHHPALAYNAAYPAALGYSAAVFPTHAVREATLTKVVNTPGHAVSYRVD